ncbi:MAG TPA: NAD(P)H-hydrate dehydratase [Actinomycetota bacterium]
MIEVLTAADVRAQDAAAGRAGIAIEALMRNAGWAVAREARAMLGGCYGRRVAVVCGKGNNGGDGLAAARILRAWGAAPEAVLLWPRDVLSGAAAANLARFDGPVAGRDALDRTLARADLVIDAVFGVGLTRAPEGEVATAIEAINAAGRPVLAIDVASGVASDTGAAPGVAVRARRTVSFTGFHPGSLFVPGAALAGDTVVAQIGIPAEARGSAALAMEAADAAALLPQRTRSSHKRSVGTVLVVAGSRAMPGAAALASAAAVHAGAGLTMLCAPEDVCRVALARTPEITTFPLPAAAEGVLDDKALDLLRPRMGEFHAVAIGPGLSTHPATVELVRALAAEAAVPVVLDADGLNAFAGAPELLEAVDVPMVLTPHAGELARLTGSSVAELEADRLGAARAAAERFGATVVLKGPGTVVAGRDGVYVNATGGAALAQGGTGDVLTGMIAAVLAHGRRPDNLARRTAAAVWLHGFAADRLAERLAPHPATASAIVAELGPAMHDLIR